jgi:hypothetical protein
MHVYFNSRATMAHEFALPMVEANLLQLDMSSLLQLA